MLALLAGWKASTIAWWAAKKMQIVFAVIVGALLVAVLGLVFQLGRMSERQRCSSAALQSRIDTLKADLDAIRNAALDDRRKSGEDAELVESHRKIIDALEQKLRSVPANGACLVSPDDVAPRGVRR